MLNEANNWCLITTYKENYSLLSAFFSFYRNYYNIKNFVLLCGTPKSRTHNSLEKLISTKTMLGVNVGPIIHFTHANRKITVSELANGDVRLWAASYAAEDFTSEVEFHSLKVELYRWVDSFLPKEITRTWVLDSDEFMRVNNPKSLDDADSLGFHFLDMIPSLAWPPNALFFSLQGWYYRRQALLRFRIGKDLMFSFMRAIGRGINHSGCKTFYFQRARLSDFSSFHHGTFDNPACLTLNHHLDNLECCRNILNQSPCCYHMAMVSRDSFLSEKLRLFSRLQTDFNKLPVHDIGRSPETANQALAIKTFDNFIRNSIFPVIRDDFLLPYLPSNLIVGTTESSSLT
jgi:hypothetical protein